MDSKPKIVPLEYRGILAEPWSLKKVMHLLAVFGPAAIVASVAIGAGETIVVVRAGAWAGYDLLWLVLLSVIAKGVFLTYLLGRYTAVSGEPISQRLARVPGPRGWILIVLVALEMAAAGPLWAAVARPCGDLLHYLVWQDASQSAATQLWYERVITTGFILAALGCSTLLTYSRLERQQVVICGLLVAGTVVGTLLIRPDYTAALWGSISFGYVPELPPWAPESARENQAGMLVTTFGYVGGSVLGYLVYANWIGLHGWGLTSHPQIDEIRLRAAAGDAGDYLPTESGLVERIRRSLLPLKWDVGCGAVVLWIVTASFMMAGAAVLYPLAATGQIGEAFSGWNLLTDQAHVWSNVHPSLVWVYYVCVLLALWGTLQAFPEIYCRVIYDFSSAVWPASHWDYRRVQRVVACYVFLASTLVVWSDLEFDIITQIVAFLTTNLAVAISMLAALYLNFQLPIAYRTRWWVLVGSCLSAFLLLAVAAVSGVSLWAEIAAVWTLPS